MITNIISNCECFTNGSKYQITIGRYKIPLEKEFNITSTDPL